MESDSARRGASDHTADLAAVSGSPTANQETDARTAKVMAGAAARTDTITALTTAIIAKVAGAGGGCGCLAKEVATK